MRLVSEQFWQQCVDAMNSSTTFRNTCQHLSDVRVGFKIDHHEFTIRLNHGYACFQSKKPLDGWSFAVSGPINEWSKLVRGDIVYAQATNAVHGELKVDGDFLTHIWATRAMWELFGTAEKLLATEGV